MTERSEWIFLTAITTQVLPTEDCPHGDGAALPLSQVPCAFWGLRWLLSEGIKRAQYAEAHADFTCKFSNFKNILYIYKTTS